MPAINMTLNAIIAGMARSYGEFVGCATVFLRTQIDKPWKDLFSTRIATDLHGFKI